MLYLEGVVHTRTTLFVRPFQLIAKIFRSCYRGMMRGMCICSACCREISRRQEQQAVMARCRGFGWVLWCLVHACYDVPCGLDAGQPRSGRCEPPGVGLHCGNNNNNDTNSTRAPRPGQCEDVVCENVNGSRSNPRPPEMPASLGRMSSSMMLA